jgi:predicted aspartyl protease
MFEARDEKQPGFAREVRLKSDGRGHFMLDAAVNDCAATFMADTGATQSR